MSRSSTSGDMLLTFQTEPLHPQSLRCPAALPCRNVLARRGGDQPKLAAHLFRVDAGNHSLVMARRPYRQVSASDRHAVVLRSCLPGTAPDLGETSPAIC